MTVRKLYRTDKAERFEDTEGGLNQMTIRKFEDLVRNSSLEAKNIKLTPIKIFPDTLCKTKEWELSFKKDHRDIL